MKRNLDIKLNTPRNQIRKEFIRSSGVSGAHVASLPTDASFRRYYRIEQPGRNNLLLMDAPPDKEKVGPFARVARHLLSLGLSAPKIYSIDETNGFLIIEDFGNNTFTRMLAQGADEEMLYKTAIDVLVALHLHPRTKAVNVPAYDLGPLLEEAVLLIDWLWPEKFGHPCPSPVRNKYLEAWRRVFENLPEIPKTLVLRDYHVDNLMWISGLEGIKACGLLDFQDAMIGPLAYDLVSLLEDARRDISIEVVNSMYERYLNGIGAIDQCVFSKWFSALGAQRHAKVLGIFVRLFRRDGKPQYLNHIQRVSHQFSHHLEKPTLEPIKEWTVKYFPNYLEPLPNLTHERQNHA